jgi:hypothetical protein
MNIKYTIAKEELQKKTKNNDFSFVLKLNKERLPGINKIIRIPDIEEITTKTHGKLFAIKYFLYLSSGKLRVIRITSKNKSFKQIYSLDICNNKLQALAGFSINSNIEKEDLLKFIGMIILAKKNKMQYESTDIDLKATAINQIKTNPAAMAIAAMFGIVWLVGLYLKARYIFKKVYNWYQERYVSGPLEQAINDGLFASQKKDEPAYAVYNDLVNMINHTLTGPSPALIIYGPPGMSKTYNVRRALHFSGLAPRKDYAIIKGSSLGLTEVYDMLYKYRKRILILDDFDTPLQNDDVINLIKSITDSYDNRIVSLPKKATLATIETGGDESASPDKFEFKGKLIIITNLSLNQIDSAVLSRAPAIEIAFDSKKIISLIGDMLKFTSPSIDMKIKQEVYQYIISLYKKNPKLQITFRDYKNAVDSRVGNPNGWKEMTAIIVSSKQ